MKIAYLISLVFVVACIVVSTLYIYSYRSFSSVPHFRRTFFIPLSKQPSASITFEKLKDIGGFSGSEVFFSSRNPSRLLVTDLKFKKIRSIDLKLEGSLIDSIGKIFSTTVDGTMVHVFCGNVPTVISYSLKDGHKARTQLDNAFSRGTSFSPSSFVLRKYDYNLNDQIFVRCNTTVKQFYTENNLSEIVHDGGIANDGKIYYDKETAMIVYIPYYKSNLQLFDTNLVKRGSIQTIEKATNNDSKIVPIKNRQGTTYSNSRPLQIIRNGGCAYHGLLFVHSKLKADNESSLEFRSNSVIDVYNIRTGNYFGSFYIPVLSSKLRAIAFKDDKVICLTTEDVRLYHLSLPENAN